MTKNQKPAVKQQPKKKVVNPIPNTCKSGNCKDDNCKCNNDTCKCDTINGIDIDGRKISMDCKNATFKMVPEYDEILAENNGLKLEIEVLKKENKMGRRYCADYNEANDKLNAEIKTLKADIVKKDKTIINEKAKVEYYHSRGVWATIKNKWFGC